MKGFNGSERVHGFTSQIVRTLSHLWRAGGGGGEGEGFRTLLKTALFSKSEISQETILPHIGRVLGSPNVILKGTTPHRLGTHEMTLSFMFSSAAWNSVTRSNMVAFVLLSVAGDKT